MGGIILGSRIPGDPPLLLFVVPPAVLLGCAWSTRHRGGSDAIVLLVNVLLLLSFGCAKFRYDEKFRQKETVASFAKSDTAVTVIGVITEHPRAIDRTVRFVIDAESIRVRRACREVEGGVLVMMKRDSGDGVSMEALEYGTRVSVAGTMMPLMPARNPGEFDPKRYYELNDIDARMITASSNDIGVLHMPEASFLGSAVVPARRSVGRAVDRYFQGEEANFLKGLIVGERTEIAREVKSAFINAGVMHILAVSGLHVAIVVMILLGLMQLLRLPRDASYVLTMVALVYYNFLTGGAASVLRSVIMAIVFLGGRLLELKTDMVNTLAVSALVILLIDARQLFQPGFQLSYAAVVALVVLTPRLYLLRSFLPDRMRENVLVKGIAVSLAVSIAAGIGTLPFTAIYFERVSLVSFIANIVIVPLSNLILGLGMATVALSYFSSWLASCLAATVSLCTWIMLELVGWFGTMPFAYVEAHVTTADAVWYYYAIGVLLTCHHRAWRVWNVIALLVVANVCVYRSVWFPQDRTLRVTFLDVGQGDAVLVSFPDGATMLVDGGPRSATLDAGTRFVIPFLKRQGIGSLSSILLSHPHSDHLGGLLSVIREYPPQRLLDAGSAGSGWLFSEYQRLADSLQIEHDTLRDGMRVPSSPEIRVFCLNPPVENTGSAGEEGSSLNNKSVVLKIVYGATSILLMGDAEEEVERRLIPEYGEFLSSHVIKVAHHGSATSSSLNFVKVVRPECAVISVGVNNKFHHPSRTVIQGYRNLECDVTRTDEAGASVLESDGTSWRVVKWHP